MNHPTIIITGASRGLGAAAAQIMGRLKANVVLTARSFESLESQALAIQQTGGTALAVVGDIRRDEDCQEIIRQAFEHFGQIDGLVNNSGIIQPIAPIAEADRKEWEMNWATNVFGPVRLTQMALPYLRSRNGRIVNITSGAAENVVGGWAAYSTAKAALNHFTRILASEEPTITAVALRPGIVDTEMQTTIRETGANRMASKNYEMLSNLYEQGKLLPAEQPGKSIAALTLFAPHEWSGEIILWNDERVLQLIREKDMA